MKIDSVIDFCRLVLQFQSVERRVMLPYTARDENDAEHSYMLAVMAWYIGSTFKLKLDLSKVIKYALAHDMVETYAGDTPIFDADKVADKAVREEAAMQALRENYPEFDELHETIVAYEHRADEESRFVYALDKILPIIIIYLGEGTSWHRDNVTLEMMEKHKRGKVRQSAAVEELYDQLMKKLESQPELFAKTKAEK